MGHLINSVYSNTIVNPSSEEEPINNEDQENNMIKDNDIIRLAPSSTLLICNNSTNDD